MNQIIKKRKKWKLSDITAKDVELLQQAAHLPEKTWFCFGWAYYKLFDLHLVDEDTFITPYGVQFVHAVPRLLESQARVKH